MSTAPSFWSLNIDGRDGSADRNLILDPCDKRPQYLVFPYDANGFAIDDQYYIGDTGLLVKPAVKEEATSVDIYLAEDQVSLSIGRTEAASCRNLCTRES